MRSFLLALLCIPCVAMAVHAERISGPYEHHNLALYLVHADGTPAAADMEIVPLDAALTDGTVVLHETGDVNQLAIENRSATRTVFVQAGDIVKGGKQDRVLSQDLVLQPRSGKVPIASFCVERGRWSGRGSEAVGSFASSKHALSSKELKLAARGEKDQGRVWAEVDAFQRRLSAALEAPVADRSSETSLQLSLENGQLAETKRAYLEAMRALPEAHADAVGVVVAVNGELQSADWYATAPLFRALWSKLLDTSATEAVAGLGGAGPSAPSLASVEGFLAQARSGTESTEDRPDADRSSVRESADAVFFESRSAPAVEHWLHRSVVAR